MYYASALKRLWPQAHRGNFGYIEAACQKAIKIPVIFSIYGHSLPKRNKFF